MVKTEAKWQTIWSRYLHQKHARGEMYGYYELKQTPKDSLLFSKIRGHQYGGLQVTARKGMVWKFSDDDRREKPCDCASLPPLPSYVVIKFPDAYYVIPIIEIVKLRDAGGISITHEQAKRVAEKILVLGKLTPEYAP